MRSLFLSVLAACIFASPAAAWDEAGHRKIAGIAFDLLHEQQQRRVAEILSAHPRYEEDFVSQMSDEIATAGGREEARWTFAQASIWPDIVQSRSEAIRHRYHRGSWHYINLPLYLTERDAQELAGRLDHNISTDYVPPLRPDLNIVQALQGNLRVWRDKTSSDTDKAVALCWVLHLAGDVHEPLHTVALFSRRYFPEGDRGGNLIAVARDGDVTNLHAVWDGLADRFDDPTPDDPTKNRLARDVADITSIDDWARNQRQLAKQFAYTEAVKKQLLSQLPREPRPRISLSAAYLATAENIARSQVIVAGHRIAALMEQE